MDTIKSVYNLIDPNRRINTFELFGYDFMIDDELQPFLIEANINPCLGVTSPFSSKFITTLIEDTFRLVFDPLFPPPEYSNSRKKIRLMSEIKYELIFDEKLEKEKLKNINREILVIDESSLNDSIEDTGEEIAFNNLCNNII